MDNFSEIIPGLWMGGELLPVMADGFDAVLSCREIEDFELIPTLQAFLWLPMKDEPKLPKEPDLDMGFHFIRCAMDKKLKTLVHCTAGHNRSGLLVADFLINGEAMKPQDAIDLIRLARGPSALSNQTFLDYLLSL